MKKFLTLFFCFVVILLSSSAFANGGGGGGGSAIPVNGNDSLRTAQVFAGMDIASCDGYFGFMREELGASTWMHGKFTPTKSGNKYLITYLEINEIVITDVSRGDKPRYGIPPNAVGVARDYSVNIVCREKNSNAIKAYGYFYTPVLEADEPIVITLEAASQYIFVPFVIPEGFDQRSFFLEGEDGSRYMYDPYNNGFSVYINPIELFNYSIGDYDGNTYVYGSIDPLAFSSPDSQESVINIGPPKGINEVTFNDQNYWYAERRRLNGWTMNQDGQKVRAEVYYMDLAEAQTNIYLYGITGAKVRVFSWKEKGEMPEISTKSSYDDMNFNMTIPSGYNKIIVVVTGASVDEEGYYIGLNRWIVQ